MARREAEIEALIVALHAKLDTILDRLPVVDSADTDMAEKLFPALAGAIGSERFSASEALEYPAIRAVVGRMNAIALGQLLGRVERKTIRGFRVYRHAVGRKTLQWQLVRVVDE